MAEWRIGTRRGTGPVTGGFARRRGGATGAEYGLMFALVVILGIAAITLLGEGVRDLFGEVAGGIDPEGGPPVAGDVTLPGSIELGAAMSRPASQLLANSSDPDSDPLSVTAAGPASAGSVNLSGDTLQITAPGSGTQMSFPFTISDGTNAASATATLAVASPALFASFDPPGNDNFVHMAVRDDGAKILATRNTLFELDPSGVMTGEKFISLFPTINDLAKLTDGNFGISGEFFGGNNAENGFIGKVLADGSLDWFWQYADGDNRDVFEAVAPAPNGGVIAVEKTDPTDIGAFPLLLLRFDSNGTLLWAKLIDPSTADPNFIPQRIVARPGGGWVMVDTDKASVLFVDDQGEPTGHVLFQDFQTATPEIRVEDIAIANDGGILIAGEKVDPGFGVTDNDSLALKIQPDGTVDFARSFEVSFFQSSEFRRVVADGDGGVFFGVFGTPGGDILDRTAAVRFSGDGTQTGMFLLDQDPEQLSVQAVARTSRGFMMAGSRFNPDTFQGDSFVINLDENLNFSDGSNCPPIDDQTSFTFQPVTMDPPEIFTAADLPVTDVTATILDDSSEPRLVPRSEPGSFTPPDESLTAICTP